MTAEVETMAYAGEVPWHGMGNKVEGIETAEEMAAAAGISWKVAKAPLFYQAQDGEVYEVHGRYALVRDSDQKMLTVTGESWSPVQNTDMLSFMRDFARVGGATLETAGSLRGGKVVWGLARLAREFEVRRGDKVQGYVLFTSPHEVGKASILRTTSVRVVCMNTMMAATREGTVEYRQSHQKDFDFAKAQAAIANANEAIGEMERRANIIAGLKIGMEDAVRKVIMPVMFEEKSENAEFMETIMNVEDQPKVLQEIISAILTGPGAEPGTGWGVMNGITFWADHKAGRTQDARLVRSWMGDLANTKIAIEERLLELAS